MRRSLQFILCAGLLVAMMPASYAATAKVGQTAPDFSATDSNGHTHRLSEYKGKFVVLEWSNQGCPFTRKHYDSGNMQKLQKEWTAKGVIWLTVISSRPGAQGYVTGAEENDYLKRMGAAPSAALLDPTGTLGHLYGAKTTPDMYVINPQGKLIYAGAVDNKPTFDQADIAGATNYVSQALAQAMGGKAVTTAATQPYGCSVKYAD